MPTGTASPPPAAVAGATTAPTASRTSSTRSRTASAATSSIWRRVSAPVSTTATPARRGRGGASSSSRCRPAPGSEPAAPRPPQAIGRPSLRRSRAAAAPAAAAAGRSVAGGCSGAWAPPVFRRRASARRWAGASRRKMRRFRSRPRCRMGSRGCRSLRASSRATWPSRRAPIPRSTRSGWTTTSTPRATRSGSISGFEVRIAGFVSRSASST
mmetsp:Transcript_87824/g.253614  ORF Transcript_87824/g.253614 Transcript_87824/m.253614 type:complete len:213 (+) Transcript_87824:3-641(+)